jgi:regulator of sirC expression with transglutaminase-like and TPR domain
MIVVRMLHNLRGIASQNKDTQAMLRYLDTALAIAPDAVEDRSLRAVIRAQSGDRQGALADVDWILENRPDGADLRRVKEFRDFLERGEL